MIATEAQLTYDFRPSRGASMNRLLFTATLLAIIGAGIPAVADGTGRSPVREYKSMWDPDPGSEHMWLAEDFASFSGMRGHLVLAYAGMMPPENEKSDPNIKMYRVVNAEEFFRLNKGNNEYPCAGLPARWLGVSSDDGPGNPNNGDVRILLYDIDDYLAFREDKTRPAQAIPTVPIPETSVFRIYPSDRPSET